MALVWGDRTAETSTTTGTGAFTLAAAVTGYQRFSDVCATNDTIYYAIFAVDANGNPSGDWETGLGTYSSANTLTRTSVSQSTNSDNAVNFAAGTKWVIACPIASIQPTAFILTLLNDADAATARATLGLGTAAVLDETTTAQYRANTADKALSTDQVWAAADYVALTDAATVAVDMSLGFNFSVTLGGNRTLGAPSSTKNGQTGAIVITQDGTGSRTLAYHANWKFAGGTDPTLSTAAGSIDVLFYQVVSSTSIIGNLVKAVA